MPDNFDKIIVLDTETSGTKPSRNQILTIDAIRATKHIENDLVQFIPEGEPFHAEVARQSWAVIEPDALRVTGIDIDLWKGEGEDEVIAKLLSWTNTTMESTYNLVCGYNVDFDINFLKRLFHRSIQFGGADAKKTWTRAFSYRSICVMQKALWAHLDGHMSEPPNFKLETVAKHLGVWEEGAHDSAVDVRMTLNVLNELNKLVHNASK